MASTASNPVRPKRNWKGCHLAGIAAILSFGILFIVLMAVTGIYQPVLAILRDRIQTASQFVLPPNPMEEQQARLQQNYIQANRLMSQKEYAAAIPYWDLVIQAEPESSSYAQRADAYILLSRSQRNYAEYLSNLTHALADIDRAIAINAGLKIYRGDLFEMRAQVYESLGSAYEQRGVVQRYNALAAENMRAAVSLMTQDTIAYRQIPFYLNESGQCEAGLREVDRIKAFEGVSAPPKVSILKTEAYGYLCLGQLEKALQKNSQALAIEDDQDVIWLQAIILFDLERYEESLTLLNRLISADPYYKGYRYYLRAAIYQQQGNREQALQDLETGSGNTWGQLGMKDYVLGQIALEKGDPQAAIARFQSAEQTLPWTYDVPLLARIRQQLDRLGAQPPAPASDPTIAATPLPGDLLTKDPLGQAQPTVLNENGLPIPPFATPVSIADGVVTVNLDTPRILPGEASRLPTYLFSPAKPVVVRTVKSLVVDVELATPSDRVYQIFLWDQTNGQWTLLMTKAGENAVEHPERYVNHQGQLYLSTRNRYDQTGPAGSLFVILTVETVDGQTVTLEKSK